MTPAPVARPGRRILLVALFSALGAPLGGCADGPDATFTSHMDRATALASLDQAQVAPLCERSRAYIRSHVSTDDDRYCRMQALWTVGWTREWDGPYKTDSAAQQACRTSYDKCRTRVSVLRERTGVPYQCSDDPVCEPDPECTATIADLEDCAATIPAFWHDSLRSLPSCDELTAETANGGGAPRPTLPGSCLTIERSCRRLQALDHFFWPFSCK
jgi:hypothetical protein